MKLLTKEQRELLLKNGRDQRQVKGTKAEKDFWPAVKLFNPAGAATWLLTELDPEDPDIAVGLSILAWAFQNSAPFASASWKAFAGRAAFASNAIGISRPRRRSRAISMPRAPPAASSSR